MRIGFFDSGLGGLYILQHVVKKLPDYHYVFLGDTENVPYGDKSDAEIYTLAQKSLRFLFEHDCSLVVFACNTASVTALRKLQDEFVPQFFPDRKVLGVIIPTVEAALTEKPKTIAVIGTERTIRSEKYSRELEKLDPAVTVIGLATPTLVPLIEAGRIEEAGKEVITLVREYILPAHPDALILGCTHYGLLKEKLRTSFPTLRILAQEEIIPDKLAIYLARHPEITEKLSPEPQREFFLTQVTESYGERIRTWFGDSPITESD